MLASLEKESCFVPSSAVAWGKIKFFRIELICNITFAFLNFLAFLKFVLYNQLKILRGKRTHPTKKGEGAMKNARVLVSLSFLFIYVAVCSFFAGPAKNLNLPTLFSDNMVFQRDMPLPVWGTASPGGKVQVEFANQSKTAVVQKDGKWKVILDKMQAGGPFQLKIVGKQTKLYKNVMVGEVWICSGQSNMEMPVDGWGKVMNYKEEIANANYPNIRLFQVKHTTSVVPLDTVNCAGWEECSPKTIPDFSAAAYFFGRHLYKDLKVPIGLIHTSWGGTIAEAWTSGEALKTLPDFVDAVKKIEAQSAEKGDPMVKYKADLKKWNENITKTDSGFSNGIPVWNNPALKTSGWKTMKLPTLWEKAGYPNLDGAVWFRKKVNIPASMTGKDLMLHLGPINDRDITWFNGTKVGSHDHVNELRDYKIPAALVKAGTNTIVVRVFDIGGNGGIYGKARQMSLESSTGKRISLAGSWLFKIGYDMKTMPPQPRSPEDPNRPTVLYNAMLHPLIPYAIRGAIWYQGESNAGRAYQYRTLFPTMIKDWRAHWGEGNFPFLFVQLANWQAKQTKPVDDAWAELREAQLMALSLPNTGMAVTIDIGNPNDIHPKNKQEVGRRLALNALKLVYGKDVVNSGPIYKSMAIEGNKIRLSFTHVDGGLVAKGGKRLKGFAIAGKDQKFVWANAKIDGKTIRVWSNRVPHPVAVRYAWAINPICNLYNKAGLPASPFRTDQWKGITQDAK